MCVINCDITKDLIPSYLEGLCSEESIKAVEAHLSVCPECRSHLEAIRHIELSPEKSGQGQLNFMKRVKQHYARKNALGAALLFLFSLMVLPVIATSHPSHDDILYCILFSGLALGTYILLSNYQSKPKGNWQKLLCLTTFGLGILYSSCIIAVMNHCLQTDSGIFGLELSESGPYFNAQFIAIVILELLTFAVCAADSVRKDYGIGFFPTLNLTCCALCMLYREILFHMGPLQTIPYAIMQCIGLFFLLTAAVLLAEFAAEKLCLSAARRTPGAD